MEPGQAPMEVAGPRLVDIAYWRQRNSVAAHIVNLNNAMTMRGAYREAVPLGPQASFQNGRLVVEVPRVIDHEVVAVDLA